MPATTALSAWQNFYVISGSSALSAILSAPWDAPGAAAAAWGLAGLAGIVYTIIVVRRMRTGASYRAEFEDWLFHALLPLAAYLSLTSSAWFAPSHLHGTLYCVAAAVLVLLFSGIHNAWDAVTYHVFVRRNNDQSH